MFCPQCGTLAFPSPSGDINCTNYKCGYQGPANLKVKGVDGKEVDLSKVTSSSLEQTRSSDEPETRMLTCKNCGNGWREY